jgi:hypothetical protein
MNMITIELDANVYEVIMVAIAEAPARPRRHRRGTSFSTEGRAFFTLSDQLLPQSIQERSRTQSLSAAEKTEG